MKFKILVIISILFFASMSFAVEKYSKLKIYWFGQSCFYIVSPDGTAILTDPFDESIGYKIPNIQPNIVTISHDRFSHNSLTWAKGNPTLIDEPGIIRYGTIYFKGIITKLGPKQGFVWGSNNLTFAIDIQGVSIVHCGGLGQPITKKIAKKIGKVDILLIPVGGNYTINAKEAFEVVTLLKPKIVIPMNYKTPASNMDLEEVDEFISLFPKVKNVNSLTLDINNKKNWQGTYILNYKLDKIFQ